MSKRYPKQPARIRFNWGFHDGNAAAERGKVSYHSKDNHPDKAYKAGWKAGFDAFKNEKKRAEDSDAAWQTFKKNPSARGRPYAAVLNDSGFKYGMDAVTPVSWKFGYSRKDVKLGRKFYNAWWLPDSAKVHAFVAKNKVGWVGSLRELKALIRP